MKITFTHWRLLSHFVITVAFCNTKLDTFCNKLLSHFVRKLLSHFVIIYVAFCNKVSEKPKLETATANNSQIRFPYA